nr:hypothetical protein Iba_chr07dCG6720 [Ipomoea batatas]
MLQPVAQATCSPPTKKPLPTTIRARLAGEDPRLTDALACGAFSLDVDELYPSPSARLPALVKSFCSSENAVVPLLQALHRDPVGLQMLR